MKVMIFGTFDILHPGHLDFFAQARKYGDYLIAIIARDENVKKIKGRLPKNNEKIRLDRVQKSDLIDKAILGNKEDKLKVIKENKPDIICLGYDQKIQEEDLLKELQRLNINCKIYRLKSYKPEKYKSSKLSTYKTL